MKKNIFFFIIGLIVAGSVGVYATIKIQANEIEYKDGTVESALNNLYSEVDKQTGSFTLNYEIGSNHDGQNKQQFRVSLSSFAEKYNFFKITKVTRVTSSCNGVYFSTNADSATGNIDVDTLYSLNDYSKIITYTNGETGCFYEFSIEFSN